MVARAMVARTMVAGAMVAVAMVAVAPARRRRVGRDTCPACYDGIREHAFRACYYLFATKYLLAWRRGAIGPFRARIYVYLFARLPLPPLPPVVTLP